MTQPGGRQLAQMWALMTSAIASAAADVRAEGHLATEAIVAFVDGELSLSAHERAARHLAHCSLCTAEVAAQRQARSAVRDAGAPAVPNSLLAALYEIPRSAPLPPGPEELAVTEDGQLVVVQRPPNGRLGSAPPLGSTEPLGTSRRLGSTALGPTTLGSMTGRLAQGAGVVVSGLVLGALVLVTPTATPVSPDSGQVDSPSLPVNAEFAETGQSRFAGTGQPQAPTESAPVGSADSPAMLAR